MTDTDATGAAESTLVRTAEVSAVLSLRPFASIGPASISAEAAGLSRVWVTETPGRDALMRAADAAQRTTSIGVGTGIAYAFTRHPVAMAAAAIEANEIASGRFRLGIGTGPADFRTAMGVDFDHPATRLAEYIDLVRTAISSADGVRFQGRFYNADLPSFTSNVPVERRELIEVFGSGLTPVAIRAVARTADGIALHPLASNVPYLEEKALPAVEEGAAGRPFKIAAWCVTSVDDDPEAALARARGRLALYLSIPALATAVSGGGWGQAISELQSAAASHAARQDWESLGSVLPENLVHELAVVGTHDEFKQRLQGRIVELSERGVDEVVLQTAAMRGSEEQLLAEIDATMAAV